jgi:cytoskeletal protein CcmA (bactofilin family)
MNMFSRNDKILDTTSSTAASGRDKNETLPPPATETKRPQSYAAPSDFMAPTNSPRTPSVISKALKITGQLESTEDIQVDGEVDGDVRGLSVKIGSSAKVKGTVYGEEVELAGTVDGKIEAKKVILTSTAHMSGDVIHQEIKIELGAYIDGHCRPEFGKASNKNMHVAKPAAVASVTTVRDKAVGDKTTELGPRI